MEIFLIYGIIGFVVVSLFVRVFLPSIGYKREKEDPIEKYDREHQDMYSCRLANEVRERKKSGSNNIND